MLNLTVKTVPDGDGPIVIMPCSEVRYYAEEQRVHLDGTDDQVGSVDILGPGHVFVMNANGATVGNWHLGKRPG
jgi:hypothetical protein